MSVLSGTSVPPEIFVRFRIWSSVFCSPSVSIRSANDRNVTAVDSQNTLRACCSCRREFGTNPNNPAISKTLTARLTSPSTIRSVDDNCGTVELSGKISRGLSSGLHCLATNAATGRQLIPRPLPFNLAHRIQAGGRQRPAEDNFLRIRPTWNGPYCRIFSSDDCRIASRKSNNGLFVTIMLTRQLVPSTYSLQSQHAGRVVVISAGSVSLSVVKLCSVRICSPSRSFRGTCFRNDALT